MGEFTKTLTIHLETRGEDIDIEVNCEYDVLNDGIGSYEYWGQKCFDKGRDYIEITSTEWNKVGYTAEEIEEIEAVIEKEKDDWMIDIHDNYHEEDSMVDD